jgi:hypothetical protein
MFNDTRVALALHEGGKIITIENDSPTPPNHR